MTMSNRQHKRSI